MYRALEAERLVEFWQAIFCSADYQRCARYQLAKEGHPVPPLLLPTGELLRKGSG